MDSKQAILQDIHWSIDDVLTRQRVINIILGQRGVGKTFTTMEWCFNRYLKRGEKFIYMRRRQSEIDKAKPTLLQPFPLFSKKISDHTFKIVGDEIFIDDKSCGYTVALSTSSNLKGSGYSEVSTLIYDEFLAESGVTRELTKEMHKFYNLLESVFRMRDFRVLMLANTTSFNCCYRNDMHLQLPFGTNEYWMHPKKSILVQLVKNPVYEEAKMQSCLGGIIEGTAYAEYAVYNKFYMDTNTFVKKRTGTHYEILSFAYQNKRYGLYVSKNDKSLIIDYSRKPILDFQIKDIDMTDEGIKLLSKSSHPVFRYMRNYFDVSQLYYHNQAIKSELYPILFKIL